jgi:putative flippase GtrA
MRALTTLLKDSGAVARLVRFVAVGLVATATYLGLSLALTGAGWSVEAAHVVALVISLIVSYAGQKLFTFQVSGNHRRFGVRFVIATAGIVATQFALVSGLKSAGFGSMVIFGISSLYYPVASYVAHSLWTFRQRE